MAPTARRRVVVVALAATVLATGIGARLFQLTVQRSDQFRSQARRQHEQQIEIWGRRGAILDRRGRELAVSVDCASLFAHPHRVKDPETAARQLAPLLGNRQDRLLRRLRSDNPFVWLSRRLEPDAAKAVQQLDLLFEGERAFGFETEARRAYPHGRLAVHVVGFADIDQTGIEGIERVYDEVLRGGPAGYLAVRDGRGGQVRHLVQPARPPKDLVLTLDLVLQHIVERELDRAMRETGARWASAVFMDPATGEILALANRPAADLRRYGASALAARRNRAVTDMYEPGSTFKIVAAAAALETDAVYPEQRFDCGNGSIVVAGTRIGDHEPFGVLSLREILERSSNVGMIRVAQRMKRSIFRDYIVRFGFGTKTGIGLPGESTGLVAPLDRWSALSPASMAFGHEISVTPLQMAGAFATIANGGIRVPPRVVVGTRSSASRVEPVESRPARRVVSAKTARTLTGMLEGVVTRGTGQQAAVPGYRVAGKTGTAQKVIAGAGYSDTHYVASFGGFAPVQAPRLAGLVVLDSPRGKRHSGGRVAAPVFGRILADALLYLRVPPDEDSLRIDRARRTPRAESGWTRGRVVRDTKLHLARSGPGRAEVLR